MLELRYSKAKQWFSLLLSIAFCVGISFLCRSAFGPESHFEQLSYHPGKSLVGCLIGVFAAPVAVILSLMALVHHTGPALRLDCSGIRVPAPGSPNVFEQERKWRLIPWEEISETALLVTPVTTRGVTVGAAHDLQITLSQAAGRHDQHPDGARVLVALDPLVWKQYEEELVTFLSARSSFSGVRRRG